MQKEILLQTKITDITEETKGFSTIELIECKIVYNPRLLINKDKFLKNNIYKLTEQTMITRVQNSKSPVAIVVQLE